MNLQEAVERSQCERYNFPDIITSDAGLFSVPELDVFGIPRWDRYNLKKKRKIVIKISTYRGISSDAIHYYSELVVDGVYQATLSNPDKPKNLSIDNLKTYPLLSYDYIFKIKRPLTKYEKTTDVRRWEYYYENDLVDGYEKLTELISDAKEIIRLRFTGKWDCFVENIYGKVEKVNLKI